MALLREGFLRCGEYSDVIRFLMEDMILYPETAFYEYGSILTNPEGGFNVSY